ncbi:MAG: hypothetical protein ACLR23_06225 [Clostridia bacterium]
MHAGGKQNKKCTPAWRRTAAPVGKRRQIHSAATVETTMPTENQNKNARRLNEERLQPAGIWRQIPCRLSRNDHAGGKRDEICTPAGRRTAAASGHTETNSMPAQPKRTRRRAVFQYM